MSVIGAFDMLNRTLGNCIYCDIRQGCDLLKSVYGIDFCDTLELVENPKEYIDKDR